MAYYPPYHGKYNSVERCWGILELHWNGTLLDSVEAVLGDAGTMTWKGNHPEVVLIEEAYNTGVKLSQKEIRAVRFSPTNRHSVPSPGGRGLGDYMLTENRTALRRR